MQLKENIESELDTELMKQGIVNGFLAFDEEILVENANEKSGSTAVIAFITPTYIILANCGDSRAMFVRNDEPTVVTEDHKPCNPIEHKRISEAGGHVMVSRINGSLAVSR